MVSGTAEGFLSFAQWLWHESGGAMFGGAHALRILVTGGAGFIGSAFIRQVMAEGADDVVNVDCLTYAASPQRIAGVADSPRYRFVKADIRDGARMAALLRESEPHAIVHFAAESHVDRSIDGPAPFLETNVLGTGALLEAATRYWCALGPGDKLRFRFIHISTDEVFGSLGPEGQFDETSPYRPSSPYAASKAASDHLARAWHKTYGLPVIVTSSCNNYGPYQFPEKLIPLAILRACSGKTIPLYGDGSNVRDWLHVDDHAAALLAVLQRGRVGESYAISASETHTNRSVVEAICTILDGIAGHGREQPFASRIELVEDRPGHDFRYALNPKKLNDELAWRPARKFREALQETVAWYVANESWWRSILATGYDGGRLGLGTKMAEPRAQLAEAGEK